MMNGDAQPSARAWVPLVLAMLGSVCGTLIAGALTTSPTARLVGAVLGAAIPTLIGYAGPAHGLRAGVGIAITVGALFVTYGGFTLFDFATDRPKTFPLPSSMPQPDESGADESGGATGTTIPDGPGIEVTPATLHCNADGCTEPVVIRSTQDPPLRITNIEFTGAAAAAFDHGHECENQTLGRDKDCSLTVTFAASESVGTRRASLVIHQNVGPLPTVVSVEGEGEGGNPPPPSTNTDLLASTDGVQCVHQNGGAIIDGKLRDALQILFSVQLEGDRPDALVPMSAQSNLGPMWSAAGGVGGGKLVAALPLESSDYGQSHIVVVRVDPNNEVAETNEQNNQFTVRVAIPAQPGSSQSLSCTAS